MSDPMQIKSLLSPAIAHLSRLGVKRRLRLRPPASDDELARAEKAIAAPLPLPLQMREVYRRECNGFLFRWEDQPLVAGNFLRRRCRLDCRQF
ncbi:MAG TPA: hypothetical protein VGX76_00935 [Pirellulales bacterium]|nr:hypothetical protein [Pirellulales bacterium]